MPTDTPDLQVTSASNWNTKKEVPEEAGFITELPTGNVIRMRRTMDMLALIRTGQIPNPLAGIVQKMINSGDPNLAFDGANTQVAQQLLDLLDQTWLRCVLEPEFDGPAPKGRDADNNKVSETDEQYIERLADWTPKEGAISVLEVDMNDKLFVFVVAQGVAADLAKFREVTDESLASVQAGNDVPKPTKRTGGGRSKK